MYYVAGKMSAKCEWCSSFKSLCLNDEPGEKLINHILRSILTSNKSLHYFPTRCGVSNDDRVNDISFKEIINSSKHFEGTK